MGETVVTESQDLEVFQAETVITGREDKKETLEYKDLLDRGVGGSLTLGGAEPPVLTQREPNSSTLEELLGAFTGTREEELTTNASRRSQNISALGLVLLNTHIYMVLNTKQVEMYLSVCYIAPRETILMIPGKFTCPPGWTREYYGYVMAERYNHHRSTFECVDVEPETIVGGHADHNGALFYHVEPHCGSLPCPPYDEQKEMTCAVCSR